MRWLILAFLIFSFAVADSSPRAQPTPNPVASCNAAACHGDIVNTWTSRDPHRKAYSVLFNATSARIVKDLNYKQPAYESQACLACHATSTEHGADGVGCDSCHGNSSHWLAKHYEPGWKLSDKAAYGFLDTKNLVTRTTMCADCHVGGPGRNMNHDMIAAGHPRLAWDYARFHYQPGYGKHWIEKQPERDFEIRSWFIGQVAALRAAAQLTVERMKTGPFPELSEQSCYACHASLTPQTKREPGTTPTWQPWHVALANVLAQATPGVFPGQPVPKLPALDAYFHSNKFRDAERMVGELDTWLDTLRNGSGPVPPAVVETLARELARAAGAAPADYDVLAPYYLALAALHHADEKALPFLTQPLGQLKAILKYKDGSPKDFDGREAKRIFSSIR